jgi:hypothetical protein
MELLFNGSIPKDYNCPHENEDCFNIDFIEHNIRIALSDGATISYDSKNWAKTLVEYFMQTGDLSDFDIKKATRTYYKRFDFNNMTMMQKRGLRFGSYATFLGAEYNYSNNCLNLLAIGDSIAVLLSNGNFIEAFPYHSFEQFYKAPQMLSTNKRSNLFFIRSKNHSKFYKTWDFNLIDHPVLLCMTDVLGEWALREMKRGNNSVWKELLLISSLKEFRYFVQVKRESGAMKIDDATLISITF